MTKLEQMQQIEACGIVAIIRANSANELIEAAAAIHAGGVNVIEVTMTTPNALQVINDVSSTYGDTVLVGAGSVLDAETARAVMLSGADFVVSPVTKPDVIEICNRYGKVVIPGAFTPTEILMAWETGADYVKVFPSSGVGADYIKDVKAPLPQIPLVPTGGISAENAADFITAGATALGVGSALVNNQLIAAGEFASLTERAEKLIKEVQRARSGSNSV
ncbi:MAG: bifunctional 4-hydroxy-2-oxoglutarate aldolase/2-dehydro-3-deoxy-phosphogluconate aldolase [Candidatus Poribacteria bacterium]|nr:bifunctional 4-hydroxy-2-oxoglutarate aldolase/2-dehydro-3-deoxy-phosphogluconate aldolase [Candidatus Poribacteria bacterium]